jgi:hypothetical protein
MGEWEPNSTHMHDAREPGRPLPADFSAEEIAFAEELRACFPVEREELPPLFVSTLAGGERYAPLVSGYEHKLAYRVLRQLRLPRMPLSGETRDRLGWFSWSALLDTLGQTSRPLLGAMGAAMLMMVLTVVLATPSFAEGVRMIFGRTGVDQVLSYPKKITTSHAGQRPGPPDVAQTQPAQLYWPGPSAGQYSFTGALQLPKQQWSDGSITDLTYTMSDPSSAGSGVLYIREFGISDRYSSVQLVVQAGYAQETQLSDGTLAGFVDGQWVSTDSGAPIWQTGEQIKLLFYRDGLVICISADPRDGVDENALVALANSLLPAPSPLPGMGQPGAASLVRYMASSAQGIFSGEVYKGVPAGVAPDSGIGEFFQFHGNSLPSLE